MYFFPGRASAITFPTNWNWSPPGTGNFGMPVNVPASNILKVEVELLNDNATTYLASATCVLPALPADPDGQRFFDAVGGRLSSTESNAVYRLVVNLKANNLWKQWDCIYPMVGGTSNSCSWNLVNTNLYRIAWTTGSSTFGTGGWSSDGSVSFGDTQFNPATAAAQITVRIRLRCSCITERQRQVPLL